MQRIHRPLYLLATLSLLISSCQTAQANVEPQTLSGEIPVASGLLNSPSQSTTIDETNECLDCHSDQERLIETAAPEPPAETESKGVG